MLHYVYNACCLVPSGQSPVGSSELVCHWEHSWEKLLHRKWKCGLQSQLSVGSSLWATPLGVWSIVNVKYWLVQLRASKHRTEVSFQAQSWRSKLANQNFPVHLSERFTHNLMSRPTLFLCLWFTDPDVLTITQLNGALLFIRVLSYKKH